MLTDGVVLSIILRTPLPILFFWMLPLGLWALFVSELSVSYDSNFYLVSGWVCYMIIGWSFVWARDRRIARVLYLVFVLLAIAKIAGCVRYVGRITNR